MYSYTWYQWLTFFYFYCFCGWVFESTYVSILQRHPVNRGFLQLPLLPLYGSGAIMMLLVSVPFQDSLILTYLSGVIGATALEYVTGAVMEQLFKVRYWDYSNKKYNIHGYVCLEASLCWGLLTILMTHVVHRPVARIVLSIPALPNILFVSVLTVIFIYDTVICTREALALGKSLEAMQRFRQELENLQVQTALLKMEASDRLTATAADASSKFTAAAASTNAKLAEAGDKLTAAAANTSIKLAGAGDRLMDAGTGLREQMDARLESINARREKLEAQKEKLASLMGMSMEELWKTAGIRLENFLDMTAEEKKEKYRGRLQLLNALTGITARQFRFASKRFHSNPTAASRKYGKELAALKELFSLSQQNESAVPLSSDMSEHTSGHITGQEQPDQDGTSKAEKDAG